MNPNYFCTYFFVYKSMKRTSVSVKKVFTRVKRTSYRYETKLQ